MRSLIVLFAFLLIPIFAFPQTEKIHWRKRAEMGDEFLAQGNYAKAAYNYKKAWKDKRTKIDLAYQSGDAYMKARDYARAADIFKYVVKANTSDFPTVGYKYALALKQAGNYDEAYTQFLLFINDYKGDDKEALRTLVQKEVEGCEAALKMMDEDTDLQVFHLDHNINSEYSEYAPIPFTDDFLYFSSNSDGMSKIYRSNQEGTGWSIGQIPKIFKDVEGKNFGNGSFSPTNNRFYFTICEVDKKSKRPICEIFLIEQINGGGWSEPQKLPPYINEDDVNNTHPYVFIQDGMEVLMFSSNREGGNGGMDLWYVERNYSSTEMDYSLPKNLGDKINTPGDEVTPFYDDNNGMLYFSSDYHVNIGGFDVFQSEGSLGDWAEVENLGTPINSSSDDLFFIKRSSGNRGFLASNRLFGAEKTSSMDNDIFSFAVKKDVAFIAGRILSSKGEKIRNVDVSLYEIFEDGQKRLLTVNPFPNGVYDFEVVPGRKYKIEAEKSGFLNGYAEFIALNEPGMEVSKDILIQPMNNDQLLASNENIGYQPATPKSEPVPQPKKPQPTPVPVVKEPTPAPVVKEPKPMPPVKVQGPRESPDSWEVKEPVTQAPVVVNTTPAPSAPTWTNEPKPVQPQTPVINSIPQNKSNYDQGNIDVYTSTREPVETEIYPYPKQPKNSQPAISTTTYTETNNYTNTSAPIEVSPVSTSNYGNDYRVQVMAVSAFFPSKFQQLEGMGQIITEYSESGLTRVMVGGFASRSEAEQARKAAKNQGFNAPFIVKYTNGKRKVIRY